MADILGLMGYIGQQGEAGIKKGEDRRLAGLYQQALQSPDQRQNAIAQMAGIRPEAAFNAQQHFEGMDNTARQKLGQYAAAFDALPEDMKAQAYPQLAQQAQALGIPAPGEWKPEYAPNIQKLAQAFGGGASGTGVQSTFVDQQGNRIAVMRDGSVRNIGRAEDRFQMRDQPGLPLGAFDPRTGQIRAVEESATPSSAPVSIDPNLPAAVQASIRANPEQWDSLPDGANVRVPGVAPSGAAAPRPAVSQAEMARLQLAAAANDRAEEANARAAEQARLAQRGNAPAGFRFKPDGSLEPIPGGPKPAGAAASEDERKAAAWLAQATNAFGNMERALRADPAADDPGFIETYSPFEELGNRTRSDTRQQYVQAAESLSESLLRAATGAGINEHEARQKVYELTPRRGDSDAVKRQKMAAIPVYLQALKARAGRAVPQQGGQPESAPRRLKFNPATGRIE